MTTITVVIAPGPVNRGMAMGNTEISSRFAASFISSAVILSRGVRACSMSKATIKSNTPPATRKESTVTPKNRNINSPESAKMIASPQAIVTERLAISLLSVELIPAVNEINVMIPPIGLTIINIEVNA